MSLFCIPFLSIGSVIEVHCKRIDVEGMGKKVMTTESRWQKGKKTNLTKVVGDKVKIIRMIKR